MFLYHLSRVYVVLAVTLLSFASSESQRRKQITDADVDKILSQWKPEMASSADILAANVSTTVHSLSFLIPNVEVYNKSLAGKMKHYISLTFAEPTLMSFKAELKNQLHQAVKEIHEETNLLKRNGNYSRIEKRSLKREHQKLAKKIAKRIQNRYVSHMQESFHQWKRWHSDHAFLDEFAKP